MKLKAIEYHQTYTPRFDSSDPQGDARAFLKWSLVDLVRALKRANESVLITCGPDLNRGNTSHPSFTRFPE